MTRHLLGGGLLVLAVWLTVGCQTPKRPYREPPPPNVTPTFIDYTEADGFDSFFETALVQGDPVIVIRTGFEKPEWGARLNAWLAAWNAGGRVQEPKGSRKARGVPPLLPGAVDGETLREFRLLVNDLMDRVDGLAREQSAWWAEEKVRSRRVALLRPYNLRFHRDESNAIQLIFFNGNYRQMYAEYMQGVEKGEAEPGEWRRDFTCSYCKSPAE